MRAHCYVKFFYSLSFLIRRIYGEDFFHKHKGGLVTALKVVKIFRLRKCFIRIKFILIKKPSRFGRVLTLFVLVLVPMFFNGCTVSEKTSVIEDSFFIKRAATIRESGHLAYLEGDYLRSLLMYRDAYVIDSSSGTPGVQVADLIGMGRAYTGLGRMSEAERFITRSVQLAFASRDENKLADAYGALADFYLKKGNISLAALNINDAIRLHDSHSAGYAELLNLGGLIYIKAERIDEAEAAVQKAITIIGRAEGKPSHVLADSYRAMGKVLAAKGENREAGLYFTRAYDMDTWLGNDRKRALDLFGHAVMLFDSQRYGEAAEKLKLSYRLNMKSAFIEGAIRDIDKLVEVYIAMGDKRSESYYRTMREAVLRDSR